MFTSAKMPLHVEAEFLPDTLIPMKEVQTITGLKASRIYELLKECAFPQQVRIGGCSRYSRNEVLAWVEARKAERSR